MKSERLLLGVFLCAALVAWRAAPASCGGDSIGAITEMVSQGVERMKTSLVHPQGAVVAVKDGAIYLSNEGGAKTGGGRVLTIVRRADTIIHPVTGETLGVIEDDVGRVRVVSSDEKLITAEIVEGDIREGDRIKNPAPGGSVAALALALSLTSVDPAGLSLKIRAEVEKWEGVTLISPYAMERFMYDEKIGDPRQLTEPARIEGLKNRLKADYLLLLEIREEGDAFIEDMTFFDLKNAERAASHSGLVKKRGAAAAPEPKSETRRMVEAEEKKPGASGAAIKIKRDALIPAGDRAKPIGRLPGRVAALAAFDMDNDGAMEIVVGFDGKIAVYRMSGGALKLEWESENPRGAQTAGLAAGDFDGDGKPEIYVSMLVFDRVSSTIFDRLEDGKYKTRLSGVGLLFYAGQDGRLYGQRQNVDNSLEEKLLLLTWKDSAISEAPFLDLPERSRLSGIGVFDMDGDGKMDVAGFDYQHSLVYRPSRAGRWVKSPGLYGGSNITVTMSSHGDVDVHHQFQPTVYPFPGGGGYSGLVVVQNHANVSFTSSERFTKSQILVLEHDGMDYFKKKETPQTSGVIHAMTMMGDGSALVVAARGESSFFGPGESELILVDLSRY